MHDRAAVVDASPLILLSRIGRLDLLLAFERRLVVPLPVLAEIRAKGAGDPAAREVEQARFLERVPAPPIPASIRNWNLGSGESSVLAWAAERPGSLAVIDDLDARRCAELHRVAVLGTAGLVLVAKRKGCLRAARPVLSELAGAGMYLSAEVLAELLRRTGE